MSQCQHAQRVITLLRMASISNAKNAEMGVRSVRMGQESVNTVSRTKKMIWFGFFQIPNA